MSDIFFQYSIVAHKFVDGIYIADMQYIHNYHTA